MKPNWDNAPEWAQYWAQDANGAAWWYAELPILCYAEWRIRQGRVQKAYTPCPDWRDSLRERPVDPHAELKKAAQDETKQNEKSP